MVQQPQQGAKLKHRRRLLTFLLPQGRKPRRSQKGSEYVWSSGGICRKPGVPIDGIRAVLFTVGFVELV